MQVKNINDDKHIEAARSGWFECSCCPTNVARLIPSVPGYIYAQQGDRLFVNLFIAGTAGVTINKKKVSIIQENNYPWDGALSIAVSPASPTAFTLLVRIPGWSQNTAIPSSLYQFTGNSTATATIKINGQPYTYNTENGYAVIRRNWKKGDKVEVTLPMETRMVTANENVRDDIGKVALQRGPLVYCAEWKDNEGQTSRFILPEGTTFRTEYDANLLNGVMTLKTELPVVMVENNTVSTVKKPFTAIPYFSWANRGKGEMNVWFPQRVKDVELLSR